MKEKIINQLEEIIKTYGKLKFITIDPSRSTKFDKDDPIHYEKDSLNGLICPSLYPWYTIREAAEKLYNWALNNGNIRNHGEFYITENRDFISKFGEFEWFWENEEWSKDYIRPIKIIW